jgi:surface antigen
VGWPAAALASGAGFGDGQVYAGAGLRAELPPYLQCVPYARERSGVQIYGDAWTWWDQAAGRYSRGHRPRQGAVMAFLPHGNMTLGHVAAVSRVIDDRTVLLDHANWSPIDGRRGQIERGVKAIDVSPANDWSQVRVWYDPLQDLGTTAWPVAGFIYGDKAGGGRDRPLGGERVLASASYARPAPITPVSSKACAQRRAGTVDPAGGIRPTDKDRPGEKRASEAARSDRQCDRPLRQLISRPWPPGARRPDPRTKPPPGR